MKSRALALPTVSLQLVALILGLVCFFAVSVPRVQAAQLTEPQVQAILNLLTSFDVDSETVGAVEAALRAPAGTVLGTTTATTCDAPVITVPQTGYALGMKQGHVAGQLLKANQPVKWFVSVRSYNTLPPWVTLTTSGATPAEAQLTFGPSKPVGTHAITVEVVNDCGRGAGRMFTLFVEPPTTVGGPATTTPPIATTTPVQPGQTNPVVISSFSASSQSVMQGKKVSFSWKSNLTSKDIKTYGAFCSIEARTNDNRALQVMLKNKASGAVSYKPEATAKYMLLCSSGAKDGSPVARAELAVEVVPLKPSCTIKTNKGAVNVGERFTLSWKSANATIITGLPGYIDFMPLQGSQSFALSAPGIQPYTLTATGSGGTATCEVNITGKGEFNTSPASSTAPSGAQSSLLLDAAALAASAVMSAATSPFEMAVDSLTNLFVYTGVWQ